jgi:hypothetical protein
MSEKAGSRFDEQRDCTLLGLMRVVFAALLVHNAYRLGSSTLVRGYFGDHFFMPLVPEAWVPNKTGYLLLLGLQGAAALLALAGFFARPALLLASCTALYVLTLDRLQYHNNRYTLILLAFLLAFAPCDRAFLPLRKAPPLSERLGPVWARILIQLQVCVVYLASGGSKLLDPDWRGGQVLAVRYQRGLVLAAEHGMELPTWVHRLLSAPVFAQLTSMAAIATELFLAVGLWLPRTRTVSLWVGVMFHLGIELGARVESFSYLMWGAFLAFCVPELRERRVFFTTDTKLGAWLARALPRLDWLARFELVPETSSRAASLEVADRDGRRERGLGAVALLVRGLPLFFPLWLPLRIAASLRSRTGGTSRAEVKCDS